MVSATGMYLPLGTWFFPNFKQEFLFNGKRVKCLRRNVGPARRLTLPLQKGDWTKWVTPLAVRHVCSKEVCETLPLPRKLSLRSCSVPIKGSSDRRVTFLLETNFLHISGASILILYINFNYYLFTRNTYLAISLAKLVLVTVLKLSPVGRG